MLCTVSSSVPNPIPALLPAAYFPPYGVTGTLTASAWADQSGNGRDLAQGTAGNQPIYLPYTGSAYAWLPKVAGNTLTTPAAAANKITGDIDIRVWAALDDWTPSAQAALLSRFSTGNARSYEFRIETDGKLSLGWTPGNDASIITATSSVATGITDASAKWVRATLDVDNGASGYTVTFYTSDDGSTWTALGTAVTGGSTTSIAAGNDSLFVGARASGSIDMLGKVYRAQIYNGIGGTLAVDFNAADFAETSTNGATAVSSGTGETWTLNSTGAKPATIVKSPQLLGDGTNHKMATSNFTLDQPFTDYIVARQITWTSGDFLSSGTAGAAGITQRTGTPKIGLDAGSGVADNTDATLGTKCVITAVFNGASSSLQVNNGTAATGNPGAGNPGGLSLFSDNAGANYGNAIVWERIAFPAAHDAVKRYMVQRYLNTQHRCF